MINLPRVFHCAIGLALLIPLLGCDNKVVIPQPVSQQVQPAGIQTLSTKIEGRQLDYAIRVPFSYKESDDPAPLVLLLHYGYEGYAPKTTIGEDVISSFDIGFKSLNAIVIAPVCSTGDWKSARNEIAAVWLTQSIMKTYNIDTKNVIICGYSMGGEGAWFIGSRHQDLFTAALPVAAPVAGGDAEWKIPVIALHSKQDQVVPYKVAESHIANLKAKGANVELGTLEGPKHFDVEAHAVIAGDTLQKRLIKK